MIYLKIILCLVFSSITYAKGTLDIVLEPKEPVLQEPFKVNFIIRSESGDNPTIDFQTTSGLEVISRGNSQVSTRTSFINGKMTHERKVVVSYDVVASKTGTSFIKKITAEMGSDVFKHSTVSVKVLKAARKARPIFVKAEVDKEQFYVGESILVRYYLYAKATTSLSGTEVKKFPRLDKFLKRYHQESPNPQRIQVGNQLFERRVIYTAQLYGEKPGEYKIDPISLSVRYSERRSDPFGNFGFGGLRIGRNRSKTIRSKTINLEILPLPLTGKPNNFTGLVGKHDFKLKYNKSKFLSNEPIELQLSVTGKGALELFEAPQIFNSSAIEEFETSGDLVVNQAFNGTKIFDYTYLGRESVVIPKRSISFSFFDPITKSYKEEIVEVDAFEVVSIGGTSPRRDEGVDNSVDTPDKKEKNSSLVESSTEAIKKPILKTMSSFVYHSKHLFIILALFVIALIFISILKLVRRREKKTIGFLEEIKREDFDYKKMVILLDKLSHGGSIKEKIKNSPLEEKTKSYLITRFNAMTEDFNEQKNDFKKPEKLKGSYLKDITMKLEKLK